LKDNFGEKISDKKDINLREKPRRSDLEPFFPKVIKANIFLNLGNERLIRGIGRELVSPRSVTKKRADEKLQIVRENQV